MLIPRGAAREIDGYSLDTNNWEALQMQVSRDRVYVEVKTSQAAEVQGFVESHLDQLEKGAGISIVRRNGVFSAELYPINEPAI